MPFEADDQQRVDEAIAEAKANDSTKILVRDATEHQKLGPFTVICTILNRTIGGCIRVQEAMQADPSMIRVGYLCGPSSSTQKYGQRWHLAPFVDLRWRHRHFGAPCLA